MSLEQYPNGPGTREWDSNPGKVTHPALLESDGLDEAEPTIKRFYIDTAGLLSGPRRAKWLELRSVSPDKRR